ncbi:MAG: hypothetical protein IJH64_09835 [Oscillospiraceae bacterium]|nr:hypothetical protein [Oscillospiraceae bacterium]
MTKKDLISDMKRHVDGASFITIAGLQKYMGVRSHHSVVPYIIGLERINNRYFFIPDVAESIMRHGGVKQ